MLLLFSFFSCTKAWFVLCWLVSSWRVFFFIWAKWVTGTKVAQMNKKGTWFAGSCSPTGRTPSPVVARCWDQTLPHQNFQRQSTKSMDFQKVFTMGNFGSKRMYACNGPATWILTSYILMLHWLRCLSRIWSSSHQIQSNFVNFVDLSSGLCKFR